MNLNLDGNVITTAFQVVNTVILIPVFRYILQIERRLTRIETTHEIEKKEV